MWPRSSSAWTGTARRTSMAGTRNVAGRRRPSSRSGAPASTLNPPPQSGQELVVLVRRPVPQDEAVEGVLGRDVDAGKNAQAQAGIDLRPVPGEARSRSRGDVLEAVVDLRVAHRGRDEGEEL